jgi:hypothetical protein
MRSLPRGVILAILPILALANLSYVNPQGGTSLGPIGPIPLTVGDVVYVFISPPPSTMLATCDSLDGGGYRQLTSTNESVTNLPISLGGGMVSYVQLTLPSAGHYDLILNMSSQMPFNMELGILTQDLKNFMPYNNYTVQNAHFVEILTMRGLNTVNLSISFSLDVTSPGQKSFFFSIPLPSSVNALLLGIVILGLSYPNAYLLTDYHYKSKKEEVSKKRKVGIAISVILSIIVIYWVYLMSI